MAYTRVIADALSDNRISVQEVHSALKNLFIVNNECLLERDLDGVFAVDITKIGNGGSYLGINHFVHFEQMTDTPINEVAYNIYRKIKQAIDTSHWQIGKIHGY